MFNNKIQNKKFFFSKEIIWLLPIIILATFMITLSAKIKVPFYPVPMTMQTFVIMAIGVTLGKKVGLIILLTYFLEGLFGNSFVTLAFGLRLALETVISYYGGGNTKPPLFC